MRLFACEGERGSSRVENWLSTNKKQGEGVAFSPPADVASAPRQGKIKASFRCLELWREKKKQERKRCKFLETQHFVQFRRASDSMTRPTGWMEFSLKVALTHAVATIKVLTNKLQATRVIKPPQRVPCHTSAPHQSTLCKLIPTIPE